VEPLRTEGLDHVAITVSDLGSSVAFYRDVLGLESRHEGLRVPMFMLAGGSGVALFPAEEMPGDGGRGEADIRFAHVAFRVSRREFERARATLPQAGIEVRFEDHGNVHALYFRDPDGHKLELTTYEL
jgi:catechol 2,3-dioxygenase-like lactoylglutathione lyase family enzyme